MEALRTQFAKTADPAEQRRITEALQEIGVDEGLYVPLGQMTVPTVHSIKLNGLLHAPAMAFWNVKKLP